MPKLSKAAIQLREQLDDEYPERDRRSDGSFADARHYAANPSSDHIPRNGIVRAIDIDSNLNSHPEQAYAVVEQIRKCAKRGDKRIKYIIYDGQIMSPILNWKRRKYRGSNPHKSHFHISFTTLGDNNGQWFNLEGEQNDKRSKKSSNELVENIFIGSSGNVSSSGLGCRCNCKCGASISLA